MLPENLSNGLCSLRPDEDRLAFSVFAEINHDGSVGHVRFGRSVIRSFARLTYRQALALLQTPPKDEASRRVHAAWDCSSTLRKRRFAGGALDLEMPEVKVWLDSDGRPVRLELVENDISHQLIEELMLLANELVARHLKRRQVASALWAFWGPFVIVNGLALAALTLAGLWWVWPVLWLLPMATWNRRVTSYRSPLVSLITNG